MKIAIIDDQPILRIAIESWLSKSIDPLKLFQGGNGKQALEIIQHNSIDLMLLDLAMPEMDGFEFLEYVQKTRSKSFKIIAFTFYNDLAVVHRLLRLDVDGFLSKNSPPELVKKAIDEVMNNRLFLSSELKEGVPYLVQKKQSTLSRFSLRDKDIIKCLAEGKTSKEIALELGYTKRTVETKKIRIEKKVCAKNAAELVNIAYKIGILKI